MKQWIGTAPDSCELCESSFKSVFYDARILHAHASLRDKWATICRKCFKFYRCQLGLGFGQEYDVETLERLRG